MILQYSKILQYNWLSKVKYRFMAYWQKRFYDPIFYFDAAKHTAQWQNTTIDMTTVIITETKTEMTMTMLLLDKDPIVQYLIQSQRLNHALVLQRSIMKWPRPRCSRGALFIYTLDYNIYYIYPIKNIVNMWHKLCMQKLAFFTCPDRTRKDYKLN